MSAGIELSADVLERVSALVRRRAGLAFDDARRPVLETGIRAAMRRSGARRPERYVEMLERDASVLDELLAEITVGETYFFRDSEQFALLRDRIVPDLVRHRVGDTDRIRIWSAACATGEEPYSLAVLLHQLGCLSKAHILGTDISRPALQRARQARYSRWSLRGVADDLVSTYFRRVGDRFTLVPEIRDAVEFRYLNLADDGYPSVVSGVWGMDLILCRNVLIYFAVDQLPHVAERLVSSLSDQGWLLLGSADPLVSELSRCSVEVTPAGLVYRRYQHAQPSIGSIPQPASGSDAVLEQAAILPLARDPSARQADADTSPTVIDTVTEPSAEEPLDAEAARWYRAREYRLAAEAAALALVGGMDTVATRVILINSLVNCGEPDGAEAACRSARDRYGACAELAALHAFVLLEAGYTREAELAARQAVYLDPALSVAHLALGAALLRSRDGAAARRAFRTAERLLAAIPADALIPGAGDEPAGRLADLVRAQLTLLHDTDS